MNAETGEKSVDFTLLHEERGKSEFEKEREHFNSDLPSAAAITAHLIRKSVLDEFKTLDRMLADAIVASLSGSKIQGLIFVRFEPDANFTFTLMP